MSTNPGGVPPPPPQPDQPQQPPAATPTQVAGQQIEPVGSVPTGGPPPVPVFTSASGAQTNSLAVISLVAGIGSFFAHIIPGVGGFTVALVAVVTGYMARKQIRQTGEQGMGMATAGMVIGIIHIVLLGLLVLLAIFLIFLFGVTLFGISAHSGG